MSYAATGATIAAQQAIANAVKASGAIVRVEVQDFEKLLKKIEKPLIIFIKPGFMRTHYQYLTSYKGFVFHTKVDRILNFSSSTEVITADKVWLPS